MATTGDEQRTARALADPTRHRILGCIESSADPIGVAELSAAVGVTPNAVRRHLPVLVEAGLVDELHENRTTPGRPRLLYRASPRPASPYERLAVLLAEAHRAREDPRTVGRRAGAREAARVRSRTGVEAVAEVMRREGFEPVVQGDTVVLTRCPFAAAAAVNPAGVCELHLGMAEGALAAVGSGDVCDLDVHAPSVAGCRVRVRKA